MKLGPCLLVDEKTLPRYCLVLSHQTRKPKKGQNYENDIQGREKYYECCKQNSCSMLAFDGNRMFGCLNHTFLMEI